MRLLYLDDWDNDSMSSTSQLHVFRKWLDFDFHVISSSWAPQKYVMSSYFLADSGSSPDLVPLPLTEQSHSAPFSSENGAQGGDSDAWQCTPPQSTSPSGETPAHPPPSQPGSTPCSRPASQSPSPPSALPGTKKRSTKSAHMRRNIRYFRLTSIHPENPLNLHAVLP